MWIFDNNRKSNGMLKKRATVSLSGMSTFLLNAQSKLILYVRAACPEHAGIYVFFSSLAV